MPFVNEKVDIAVDQATVFDVYVNRVNEWWPRKGETNRYSLTPESTEPDRIHFDAREGGRYYEAFKDGTEHTIGTITTWDPPNEIAHTWIVEDRPEPSTISVRFVPSGDTTTVIEEHAGLPEEPMAEGYKAGHQEILGIFATFMEAR